MLELKDHQQYEMEGKLQCHSCLLLKAQVLVSCWIQFCIHVEKILVQCLGRSPFSSQNSRAGLHPVGCCSPCVPSYIRSWASKTNSASSKKISLPFPCVVNLFGSSATSSSCLFSLSLGLQFHQVFMSHSCCTARSVKLSFCRSSSHFSLRVTELLKISLDSSSAFSNSHITNKLSAKVLPNPIHVASHNLTSSKVIVFYGLVVVMLLLLSHFSHVRLCATP